MHPRSRSLAPLFFSIIVLGNLPVSAAEISPEALRVIGKIVSDPRYDAKDPQKFIRALTPLADLKKQVVARGLLADLNDFFAWSLPAEGGWPPEQVNDLVYEIVLSPRYDADVFLHGLETGGPLLKELRRSGCVDRFNARFGTAIPAQGAVSFRNAEKIFYDVVSSSGFDRDKLLTDLCPAAVTVPAMAAATTSPAGAASAKEEAAVERPTPGSSLLLLVLAGGMIAGAVLVLLARSLARDLRRP